MGRAEGLRVPEVGGAAGFVGSLVATFHVGGCGSSGTQGGKLSEAPRRLCANSQGGRAEDGTDTGGSWGALLSSSCRAAVTGLATPLHVFVSHPVVP